MSVYNYGLGNRDIVLAAKNALIEHHDSYTSIDTDTDRFSIFASWLREIHAIKDMRHISRHHVIAYAEHINDLFEHGKIGISTAHNRISTVNVVLSQARSDTVLWISPSAFLPPRSYIAIESRAPSSADLEATLLIVSERPYGEHIKAIIGIQRQLGLRFEESSKANARHLLNQAESKRSVLICDGTKGGRDRIVPATSDNQLAALHNALAIQGTHHSMIPPEMSYAEFQSLAYRSISDCPVSGFHGNRHAYAHARYESLVGAPCPVVAGVPHGKAHHHYLAKHLGVTLDEAREIDHEKRSEIAEELGHSRKQITNAYFG